MKSTKSNSTNSELIPGKAKLRHRLVVKPGVIKNLRRSRILLAIGLVITVAVISLVIYNQFVKDTGEQLIPGSLELPPEPQLSEPTFAQ